MQDQTQDGRPGERAPVAPYLAVGMSTVVYGVGERKHIRWNLDTIEDGIHAAMSVIGINMPVRLIALAEGALTGFTDEAFDVPHVVAAHDLFIDIPGEETERLGALAQALRHVPRRPVQGALARGDGEPLLQHALRHRAERRGRAQGGQEPPLVPRALVHAARRLRPLGGALRRRNRRLLPGAAHRGHRQRRDDLLLGRRVPGGGARARLQRRRGRLPAERGRPDDRPGGPSRAAPGCSRTALTPSSTASTCSARTSAPSTSIRRCGIRSTSAAAAHTSATTWATSSSYSAVRLQHLRHGNRRHRGAAAVPGDEPELELAEGPAHRGVPAHVRGADPPGQPLARAAPEESRRGGRGVPREHPAPDRPRDVHPTGALASRAPATSRLDDHPPMAGWLGARTLWVGADLDDEEDQ